LLFWRFFAASPLGSPLAALARPASSLVPSRRFRLPLAHSPLSLSLSPPPKSTQQQQQQQQQQGLAVGFVLLRVESLVEEGKL
jgi:hypothetical protein